MKGAGTCGHCGQAGHYRPRCPAFNGGAHEVVTRRVREAVAQRVAPKADGVVTDARSWGLW